MSLGDHTPVLVNELLALWNVKPGNRLLDATLGLGGHTKVFLEATQQQGTAVGLDADPEAIEEAKKRLKVYGDRVTYINTPFNHLKDSVDGGGILNKEFTHVLFDLGVGSHQLSDRTRGFSFYSEGPLSMRFGQNGELPLARIQALNVLEQRLHHAPNALEIILGLQVEELTSVIRTYGEERYARRIALALKERVTGVMSAMEVAAVISEVVPVSYMPGALHPATRTFQALRIAANRELECLEAALPQAFEVLAKDGILTVISFHSLEDRIVKNFMREVSRVCICPPEQPQCTCSRIPRADLITKKPIRAGAEEINQNPRARSSKLRALHKR